MKKNTRKNIASALGYVLLLILYALGFLVFYVNRVIKSFLPWIPLDRWSHYRGIHNRGLEPDRDDRTGITRDFLLFFGVTLLTVSVVTQSWLWLAWASLAMLVTSIGVLIYVYRMLYKSKPSDEER